MALIGQCFTKKAEGRFYVLDQTTMPHCWLLKYIPYVCASLRIPKMIELQRQGGCWVFVSVNIIENPRFFLLFA